MRVGEGENTQEIGSVWVAKIILNRGQKVALLVPYPAGISLPFLREIALLPLFLMSMLFAPMGLVMASSPAPGMPSPQNDGAAIADATTPLQDPPNSESPAPGPEDSPGPEEDLELPITRIVRSTQDLLDSDSMATERLSARTINQERSVRFLPDALLESAGVGIQRTGPAQGSPFIRGFTGFRTLISIDGFRLNHSAWRDGPNQYLGTVDPELLDSIELRYGTHNVQQGTDAIGGALLLRSQEAGPFLPGRQHTGEVATRVSSADRGIMTHVAMGGTFGPLDYRVSATQRRFGDLKGGRHVGTQQGTSFETAAADIKLVWRMRERRRLTFAHQRDAMFDAPRTHRTVDGISWRGSSVGSDLRRRFNQSRELTYFKLEWEDDGYVDRGEIGVGYHSQGESRNRIRSDLRRDKQGFDVNTLSLFANAERATSWGLLRGGIDANLERVNSFRRDFNSDGSFRGNAIQGPVADNATYQLLGVFAEDEIELNESTWFTTGLRLSQASYDANKVQDPQTGDPIALDDRFNTWSAEMRLLHSLTDEDDVYASLSRTSRLPNLSDTTRLDSARTDEIETPSPGLSPEDFLTLEIGARHRGPRLSFGAAAYWTRIRNMIIRFPTGNVVDGDQEVQKANVGDGYVTGVDLRSSWRFDDAWSIAADASWVAGRVDTFLAPGVRAVEPISRLPPLRSHLKLRWEDPDSSLWVEGVTTVAAKATRLAARDVSDSGRIPPGGTPGYTVFGIRGGFSPVERLDLGLALENLGDVDYRLHGSGVNEPGLSAIFSARYRF